MTEKDATLVALGATPCAGCAAALAEDEQTIFVYMGYAGEEIEITVGSFFKATLCPFCPLCAPKIAKDDRWQKL